MVDGLDHDQWYYCNAHFFFRHYYSYYSQYFTTKSEQKIYLYLSSSFKFSSVSFIYFFQMIDWNYSFLFFHSFAYYQRQEKNLIFTFSTSKYVIVIIEGINYKYTIIQYDMYNTITHWYNFLFFKHTLSNLNSYPSGYSIVCAVLFIEKVS